MKMEVVSVQQQQQQFQGQYSVIGSNKVKDWTSPLTPPSNSNNDEISSTHNQHHQQINNLVSGASVSEHENSGDSGEGGGGGGGGVGVGGNNGGGTGTTTDSNSSTPVHDQAEINALALRLQSELRSAKSRHLSCTEVLLPSDLLHRVAIEIIKVSEKEPCGIRGCTVYIEFEDEPTNTRRIASLKIDPNTVSTFELYLTLKHDKSGWTSILPQFLKNLARSSTIMISPEFILTKNKLYHSFSE